MNGKKQMKISELFSGLDLLDEEECRKKILHLIYPDGPRCPKCKARIQGDPTRFERFYKNETLRCSACRDKFTATGRGPFQHLKISFKELVLIQCLSESGMRPGQIKKLLGRNAETIRTTKKRFKRMEAICGKHRNQDD